MIAEQHKPGRHQLILGIACKAQGQRLCTGRIERVALEGLDRNGRKAARADAAGCRGNELRRLSKEEAVEERALRNLGPLGLDELDFSQSEIECRTVAFTDAGSEGALDMRVGGLFCRTIDATEVRDDHEALSGGTVLEQSARIADALEQFRGCQRACLPRCGLVTLGSGGLQSTDQARTELILLFLKGGAIRAGEERAD